MNESPPLPDKGSTYALGRILEKVRQGIYPVIGSGNFDRKRINPNKTCLTRFIQIKKPLPSRKNSEGFGLLLFSEEISPEHTAKRIAHDISVTHFLEIVRADGKLHPIFEPVRLYTFGNKKAHYIGKSIPSGTLWPYNERDVHANNILRIFGHHFIPDVLIEQGMSATETGFDIHGENIIINSIFLQCLECSRDRSVDVDDLALLSNEGLEGRKQLADEWASKGAKIYLFDFGTWILPKNS